MLLSPITCITKMAGCVWGDKIADCFATFFKEKMDTIVTETNITLYVYNGRRKLVAGNVDFMTRENVLRGAKELKLKNCEGLLVKLLA